MTMTREMWINLQVKPSINQRLFSPHYGFSFDPKHNNSELACLVIGEKNVAVNFFKESTFETPTKNKISRTKRATKEFTSIYGRQSGHPKAGSASN
jgi:uncharacterized protein